VNEGVELGLQGLDAAQMRFHEFHRGNLPGADACCDFGDGGEGRKGGHKWKGESIVHEMQVKREALCVSSAGIK